MEPLWLSENDSFTLAEKGRCALDEALSCDRTIIVDRQNGGNFEIDSDG